MGTVTKALKLLDYFSAHKAEIGLSEFARLSGYDKATTHRMLAELLDCGFLEQDSESRGYLLGPAILRLAALREHVRPFRATAGPILQRLSDEIGETAHLSLLEGDRLITAAIAESRAHGTRVILEPAEELPLYATASGFAVLAFGPPARRGAVLNGTRPRITPQTVTDAEALTRLVDRARQSGVARSDGGYEVDVIGMATPLFDARANCIGAVAVATPAARLSTDLELQIAAALPATARDITSAWGGLWPDSFPGMNTSPIHAV